MQYYQDPSNSEVYGYDPATQQALITQAIANGWTNVTGNWPPPPTDSDLIAQCKSTASQLLYQTDWTTIPNVSDPTNNPYLTNAQDFVTYRNVVRKYAVNPVANPTWPTQPTAVWSS
jgi:hypothetical protein